MTASPRGPAECSGVQSPFYKVAAIGVQSRNKAAGRKAAQGGGCKSWPGPGRAAMARQPALPARSRDPPHRAPLALARTSPPSFYGQHCCPCPNNSFPFSRKIEGEKTREIEGREKKGNIIPAAIRLAYLRALVFAWVQGPSLLRRSSWKHKTGKGERKKSALRADCARE